ncbi:MAG: helix-turn-helix domain-containing protein [Rhizobiaceae bacterium]|nr:helix-turn-helix domain-containing protein [Rhizobiaceae bacterium]
MLGSFGRVALVELGHCLVRHAHPHCHMVFKVAGADTHFIVGDEAVPVTEETAVLIDAWSPHSFVHVPGQPTTQILALYIEPEWLSAFRPDWIRSGEFNFFNTKCGHVTEDIRELVKTIVECLNSVSDSPADTEALLSALVVPLIDRFSAYGRGGIQSAGTKSADWRIRKAIGHIRGNAGDSLTIDNLIDEIGMSRSNFFRRFKACTGMSPGLFQNVVRLEQAVQLTISSHESLGSAARRLGFVDQAHFSRFFRNHTAVSPRQYRQGAIMPDEL